MPDDFSYAPDDTGLVGPKPAKAAFGYYGAKQRIASRIITLLPPHNAWVEAFCGSAAITVAKSPAPIEVINDKDDRIVNLFTQLRVNPEGLCRAVELTPYARSEFDKARAESDEDDALECARQFLVSTMMTVNGTVGSGRCGFSYSQSYSRDGKEARVNRWYNLPERLAKVVDRLRAVRVENRDAREILEMFARRPATLMYLDPPYFVKRDHGYVIDANDESFHQELLEACLRAKCMLLISAYENELYSRLLSRSRGWTRMEIDTHTRDTKGTCYPKTEVLWFNDKFAKAAQTGRVPIRLSHKEQTENKINPER